MGNRGRDILGIENEQLYEVICKISELVKVQLVTSLNNLNRKKTINSKIVIRGEILQAICERS